MNLHSIEHLIPHLQTKTYFKLLSSHLLNCRTKTGLCLKIFHRAESFHYHQLFRIKKSKKIFLNKKFYNFRNDFTCICFGQTGSGKTHTLFGTKSEDGVCVLTAQTLFANNERLFCGFYEIYNGQLYDLINQNNR